MSPNLTDGIVRILNPNASTAGTGFIVSDDGLIVTCAHVVKNAGAKPNDTVPLAFEATKNKEKRYAIVEAKYWRDPDKGEDVAVLRLQGSLPKEAVPLPLGSSAHSDNHDFSTFGFSAANPLEGMRGGGQVLGTKLQDGFSVLQLRCPEIARGFSGAPIWDNTSQVVIGMVTSSMTNKEVRVDGHMITLPSDHDWRYLYTAFATPTETLREVCSELRASGECPYRQLVAFTEADARVFCGRESFVQTLLQRLHDSPRFLAILGPSGSGKSSVVRAGLIPGLREGALPGSGNWEIEIIRPTDDPFQLRGETSSEHLDDLTQRVNTWLEHHPEPTSRFMLVIDQFEELLVSKDLKPSTFISRLTNLLDRLPGFTLIIVMRDDFYSQFVGQEPLRQWLDKSNGAVNIPQMLNRCELEAIIREPARRAHVSIQDGLVDLLLKDALGAGEQEARSTSLPLLEFTLTRLWEKRQDETLTLDAYYSMHGIKDGFTSWANITYDRLVTELPSEHRHFIQRIFMDLVHVGDEHLQLPNSRQRKTLDSLWRNAGERQPIQEIVNKLVDARLLVESEGGIEIIHDVLLNEWDYLKNWIEADRAFSLWHQNLEQRIHEWEGTNVEHVVKHDAQKLLRGNDLKEAKLWQTKRKVDLSLQDQNFIKASSMRRLRFALSMIVIVFMLASATGIAARLYFTQPPSPTLVTTLQDNVDGSLRYCLNKAPSGSTITFAQGLSGTIELTGDDLVIGNGERLTVVGPGANRLTISAGNRDTSIHVFKGATLSISGLSFKNHKTPLYIGGAFLFNEGTLTVSNSLISDTETLTGTSISFGGGIENLKGILTVISSTFSNNAAVSQTGAAGGAIWNDGTATVTNSIFLNNSASGPITKGGAIYNDGTATVTNSTFSNNSARTPSGDGNYALGGGIDNEGKLTVTQSTFSSNSASSSGSKSFGSGGGIYNLDTASVTSSTFLNNSASASGSSSIGGGGGIFNYGTASVTSSTFSNNSASASGSQSFGGGGGIGDEGKLTVTQSTFSNNSASGSGSIGGGGGIFNYDVGTVMVTSSTFSGNKASGEQEVTGGGIDNEGSLTVTSSTFSNNSVSGGNSYGGGIFNLEQFTKDVKGTLLVTASTFLNNSASGKQVGVGGGIGISNYYAVKGYSAIIRFCTLYGNASSAGGGGIWIDPTSDGHLTISSSIVAANRAPDGPDISGALLSNGYNLIENITGATGFTPGTDRQVTLVDLKIDSTLHNNGGSTQTLALLQGSPAIDAVPQQACSVIVTDVSGHTTTITTDQRGMKRPDENENRCDIGAYEFSP